MRRAERERLQRETVAGLQDAVTVAAEEGAVAFHVVWLLPDGEFGDAYECEDLLAMTEAVNASALTARIIGQRSNKA